MNRQRQVGVGLAVGTVLPLAVIGIVLVTRGHGSAHTVRIAATGQSAPAGPRVTDGRELTGDLLTAAELGSGWKVWRTPPPTPVTMDGAVTAMPDVPAGCAQDYSQFRSAIGGAFRTPYASVLLYRGKPYGQLQQTVFAFHPGVADEAMAYLRGLVARCPRGDETVKLSSGPGSGGQRMHTETTLTAGPRLGDESVRLTQRSNFAAGPASGIETVYLRKGDLVLVCQSTPGALDPLVARAYGKLS